MKYICAQPATQYFGWQIDVMLYSFVSTGVNMSDVHIVCAIQNVIDPYFDKLKEKYPNVVFAFYDDTRVDKNYISSIRPNILKQHFTSFPELQNEVIFYHDCDIAFTKPLDLPCYVYEDKISYLSDTVSYIGYEYILSKGKEFVDKMCGIVGIDEDILIQNQEDSGGAQYIMKGIDKYFWYDVENDCNRLFKEISELNATKKQNDPNFHEIQIWCADMWGVLWNLWKRNKQTKVIKELDFLWSITPKKNWHNHFIYHNAGVTAEMKNLFFKGSYINSLPDLNLNIENNNCSYNYYKLIQLALS